MHIACGFVFSVVMLSTSILQEASIGYNPAVIYSQLQPAGNDAIMGIYR